MSSLVSSHHLPTQLSTRSQVDDFLSKHDTFLVDCDGVLWRAGSPIPGSAETLQFLLRHKKRIIFVTNNSTISREDYAKKFKDRLNLKIQPHDIVTSASATAAFLSERHPEIKKVFVCGAQGVVDELELRGISCIGGPPHATATKFTEEDFSTFEIDPDVSAVVIGCKFIATNRDPFDKLVDRHIPGNGSMVAAVEASIPDHAPPTVCGKPSAWLSNMIMSNYQLDPNRTCMVGDRLNTDIEFGNNAQMNTLLVLTGTTHLDDVLVLPNESVYRPTWIADSFSRLLTNNFEDSESEDGLSYSQNKIFGNKQNSNRSRL